MRDGMGVLVVLAFQLGIRRTLMPRLATNRCLRDSHMHCGKSCLLNQGFPECASRRSRRLR